MVSGRFALECETLTHSLLLVFHIRLFFSFTGAGGTNLGSVSSALEKGRAVGVWTFICCGNRNDDTHLPGTSDGQVRF